MWKTGLLRTPVEGAGSWEPDRLTQKAHQSVTYRRAASPALSFPQAAWAGLGTSPKRSGSPFAHL